MRNKSRRLAGCMTGAALGLLVYCTSFYTKAWIENREAKLLYENIREECLSDEEPAFNPMTPPDFLALAEDKENRALNRDAPHSENKDQGAVNTNSISHEIPDSFGISWNRLRKISPDVAAWISIPGADISYPVVQGEDDEYYLYHSISGEEDPFGSIFLGCKNRRDFRDSHTLVYGHNMEGNMMFANLNRYEREEFRRQCPVFYIYTPKRAFCYEIFSVEEAETGTMGFQYGYRLGSGTYGKQLQILKNHSLYETGVIPDFNAPFVTLITCNSRLDENIRTAIHGTCIGTEEAEISQT